MSNLRVKWGVPPKRKDGTDLPQNQLDHAELLMKGKQETDFIKIVGDAPVEPGNQLFENHPFGTHVVRVVWVDIFGQMSMKEGEITLKPAEPGDFTLDLSEE